MRRFFLEAPTSQKEQDARLEQIRQARVDVARRHGLWTEVEEAALVPRARHLLVHSESDEVFTRYPGVTFASGSSSIVADQSRLHFYVRDDGEIVFLEQQRGTWSERVEQRARREARRG